MVDKYKTPTEMIAIVDYGAGNLKSVSKAFEAVGASVKITSFPQELAEAGAIVLPGVGAFYKGMMNLRRLGILHSILEIIKEGRPFLGICLGFQLLFSESQEHGLCQGFNIIKGKVKRLNGQVKIPHMGWNQVKIKSSCKIFEGIPNNSYFYFVHSYYAEPEDEDVIIATTEYGREFVSAIAKDNILGVQFHPEKSSSLGLKILENFCRYVG